MNPPSSDFKRLGEFGLIDRLTANLSLNSDRVLCGVGDDATVLRNNGDALLLATCDIQIEGVHFDRRWFTAEQVGKKAAAVNLSDIAAMGGNPTVALVSLAVPIQTEIPFLDGIYKGLRAQFDRWGVTIVGGNTARSPGLLAIDVTLLGEVSEKNLLLRSGAKMGDVVCVSGALGGSAAGLQLLTHYGETLDNSLRRQAVDAHCTPSPRISEGKLLGSTNQITACIDISDGLLGDAGHLARASGVGLLIDLEKIPVSPLAEKLAQTTNTDAREIALYGGEDYELLFTVSSDAADAVLERLERETGTRANVVGEVVAGKGVVVNRAGSPMEITGTSFDHFLMPNGNR